MRTSSLFQIFPAVLLLGISQIGLAHQVSSVSLIANIDTKEKTYLIDVAMEVVPSDEQEVNDQISPEDAAREFAQEYLTILFDEAEQKPEIEIEVIDASDENTTEELQRKQVVVNMPGQIPESAKEFLLYIDPSCPMAVIMVTIKDGQPSRRMQVILAGEYSRPVSIEPIVDGDPFEQQGKGAENSSAKASAKTKEDTQEKPVDETQPAQDRVREFGSGWKSFFVMNFLPLILLISIFLLTTNGKTVFLQVAVLMVAQSLSLTLAAFQILPAVAWVSVALGILVAAVSLEAVFHRELRWWRLPMVAIAGLAAGWVLASTRAFREVFQRGEDAAIGTVVEYVLGVELAFIVAGVLSAIVLLSLNRFDWYRKGVVQPIAIVIAAYALFCSVERFL